MRYQRSGRPQSRSRPRAGFAAPRDERCVSGCPPPSMTVMGPHYGGRREPVIVRCCLWGGRCPHRRPAPSSRGPARRHAAVGAPNAPGRLIHIVDVRRHADAEPGVLLSGGKQCAAEVSAHAINTEPGGQIRVVYSAPSSDCLVGVTPPLPHNNSRQCFPHVPAAGRRSGTSDERQVGVRERRRGIGARR